MQMEKCTECGAPMRRTGFEENQRRDTVFTDECEQCGNTMKKTLKRDRTRRQRDKK
jgi:predicted nucleic acid-binding Zn ribbon protein